MDNLCKNLMLGCSTAAMVAAMSAGAQAQDTAAAAGVEQVVVSASRISIAGYTAPTPVTAVGAAQLEADAQIDVGNEINQLPAMGIGQEASTGAGNGGLSGGTGGEATVNIRNLGITRTLVLFDGQRVVQSNVTGGVDLSTVPTELLSRVDVVTGGASASWGSDAVSGVVNLILNKNFTGFKADLTYQIDANGFYPIYKSQSTYGTDFAGGRGHFIVSAEYSDTPYGVPQVAEPWFSDTWYEHNPAYNSKAPTAGAPQYIIANNPGFSQATEGGLIQSSPAGTISGAANLLRGINFVGPAAVPTAFNFGTVDGGLCFNCSGNLLDTESVQPIIAIPQNILTIFNYESYKLTDNIRLGIQLNYGKDGSLGSAKDVIQTGFTVYSDNAYIPSSIQTIMQTNGITSFTMGSLNENNEVISQIAENPHQYFNIQRQNMFGTEETSHRNLMRGVVTLDGTIGDDWSWDAYYQHGTARYRSVTYTQIEANYLALADDAVTVTAANRGASGLAIGSVACRSTLTTPTNGCVPLDPFGQGVASQAAINYLAGYGSGIGNYAGSADNGLDQETQILNEDVASGEVQGTLPWQLGAGPIAVAFGGEYRKEGGRTISDPRGVSSLWGSGNFTNFAGQYYIEEGFGEVDVPVVKNGFVQSLDVDLAGRVTSYSTSGLVETWKLGMNSQFNDDVRVRGTWSLDIRAPSLSELFAPHALNQGSSIDPKTNKSVTIYTDTTGNPNLVPEEAITISGGVVLTPHWVDGLSMSFDWYSIDIKKAIASVSGNTIITLCNEGSAFWCGRELYDGGSYVNALGHLEGLPVNNSSTTTSGLDFQADYATPMPLLPGNLALHLAGNYTDETITTTAQPGTPVLIKDSAGEENGLASNGAGLPKFKATLSATYTEGPYSGTVQTRIISSAVQASNWTSLNVANNSIPWVAYMDLRGSYSWTDNIQLYGGIDNFFDTPPPLVPPSSGSIYGVGQSAGEYDDLGRVFRLGVRFNY